MPVGEVGGGHQNRYDPIGEIKIDQSRNLRFRKGDRLEAIKREDPPCWNAGTPVRWDIDLQVDAEGIADGKHISVCKLNVDDPDGTPISMLATTTTRVDNVTEYHPLIQFFNEVIAGIVRDGMTSDLDDLRSPTSARNLWKYLERKYLNPADSPEDFARFMAELHKRRVADKLTDGSSSTGKPTVPNTVQQV